MTRDLVNKDEQEFYLTIGGETYKIRLYSFKNLTYVDVSLNDEYLVAGQRVIQGGWILPPYMTSNSGNFRFETYASDGDDYVLYDGFNTKFRFSYYTISEINAMGGY